MADIGATGKNVERERLIFILDALGLDAAHIPADSLVVIPDVGSWNLQYSTFHVVQVQPDTETVIRFVGKDVHVLTNSGHDEAEADQWEVIPTDPNADLVTVEQWGADCAVCGDEGHHVDGHAAPAARVVVRSNIQCQLSVDIIRRAIDAADRAVAGQ